MSIGCIHRDFFGGDGNPFIHSAFFEIIFDFFTMSTGLPVVVDVGIVVDFLSISGKEWLVSGVAVFRCTGNNSKGKAEYKSEQEGLFELHKIIG